VQPLHIDSHSRALLEFVSAPHALAHAAFDDAESGGVASFVFSLRALGPTMPVLKEKPTDA
jgi:hypothetical protein